MIFIFAHDVSVEPLTSNVQDLHALLSDHLLISGVEGDLVLEKKDKNKDDVSNLSLPSYNPVTLIDPRKRLPASLEIETVVNRLTVGMKNSLECNATKNQRA